MPFSRGNGRSATQVRPIHIALSVLSHCHSSCCVEVGNTRVVCAVQHPQQLIQEYRGDRGRVACEVHRASSTGMQDDETVEMDLSLALEGVAEQLVVLESIPQLLVEVTLEIVRDDGALWDALCTALATGLAAGGINMLDMFSACSAALLGDGSVVVDVTKEEESKAKAMVTVCTSLNTHQIVFMRHHGPIELSTLTQLMETSTGGVQARKQYILSQIKEQKRKMMTIAS